MKKNGFTLIELMVASVILVLIIGAIYTTFRIGLGTWRRAEEMGEVYDEARLTLRGMTKELHSLFTRGQGKGMDFVGETDYLRFVYALSPEDKGYDLRAVEYSLEDRILVRRERFFPYSSTEEGFEEGVWEGISRFNLGYFDGESWLSSWEDKEGLPLAVKISVYPESSRPFYAIVELPGGFGVEEE